VWINKLVLSMGSDARLRAYPFIELRHRLLGRIVEALPLHW